MYVLFLWGACLGSFLNVCIYRWPRGLSVVRPRSYCPNCKKSIPWFYNIPILSFIVLKGKAQCCHLRLSWQDFGVEVFSAIFLVLNFKAYPLSLGLMNTAFFCCLIVASGIDLDAMFIPDSLTLGGLLGTLVLAVTHAYCGTHLICLDSLAGSFYTAVSILASAAFGAGFLLLIAFAAEKIFRQEAIGMGDIKLMAFIGAFCGWPGAVFSIFVGSMLGTIILVPIIGVQKLTGKRLHGQKQWAEQCRLDPSLKNLDSTRLRVPFGPWLSLAAIFYVLFFKLKVSPGTFLY